MGSEKQKIRRSQFVLVYGPGSIIEGPNGSRLMPSLKGLGEENCNDAFFTKYEIKDVRMSHMLTKENDNDKFEYHLLSIPSNDSIDDDEPRVIYSTAMFPVWHLCFKRNPTILYFHKINEEHCSAYDEDLCSECEKEKNPNVRFVRACPKGHLDEVYWYSEVHGGDKSCSNKNHFYWKATGSSLEDIVIECPVCHSKTNMKEIYKNRVRCTGRLPENEEYYGYKILSLIRDPVDNCNEEMSVIQKQSSSLRLPYTRTLLKIPTFDESILDLFNISQFSAFLKPLRKIKDIDSFYTKEDFKDDVFNFLDNYEFWLLEEYLEKFKISDLFKEYHRVGEREPSFTNAVDEEFKAIKYGKKDSANFSRSDFKRYYLDLDYNFPLDVSAIYKLTTVTSQLAYQRKPHPPKNDKSDEFEDNYKFIPIGYKDEKVTPPKVWYPAYKGVGEGIFITSHKNPFEYNDNLDKTIDTWKKCTVNVSDRPETENPLFVWWHTLSHAIIKSLSLSCGYSSASLHERVYLDEKSQQGGILIYNTSPSDDSGMGGLVDLVFNEIEFKKVLRNAMDTLLVCSNDPLCSSVKLEDGGFNGSACHNCLLVSETSCEHQNQLLDRNFFIN
jgi:hypothetical protein